MTPAERRELAIIMCAFGLGAAASRLVLGFDWFWLAVFVLNGLGLLGHRGVR